MARCLGHIALGDLLDGAAEQHLFVSLLWKSGGASRQSGVNT